jgi:hypothetical protein
MRTFFLFALVGSAVVYTAACSSPRPEAAGSTSVDLVVDAGVNESASLITLQLPTDACIPGATCGKILGQSPALSIDGASVALGATTQLVPGTHTIAVNNVAWQITTTAGESSTIVLPIADTKCSAAALPNVPATSFGGSVAVSDAACPTVAQGSSTGLPAASPLYYYAACNASYVAGNPASSYNCASAYAGYSYYYENSAGACINGGAGVAGCAAAQLGATPGITALTTAYEAYAPGTLTATVDGAAQSLTLNPGDEVDFDIGLPVIGTVPATFATTLTFLDPRANPDAAQGTITSSCAGERAYTIPSSTGITAPLALAAFVNNACTYTLSVGGRTQVLSQTSPNAIGLHRLDVDNVTITREDLDGGTYSVVGTYTLNYGGVQVAGPYNTGTGIDVLPGTYEFSLTYTDFDGPQTQTQTLTF